MIEFVRITKKADPLLKKMERTYVEAFPEKERREIPHMEYLVEHNPMFTWQAILNDGEYVGFLAHWTLDDFIYGEYLAIEKELRNKGIGGKAFSQFVYASPLPIVGEVETPVDDLTRRRVNLYKRIGFSLYDHPYFHPPFHKNGEEVELCMIAYGDLDPEKEFDRIKMSLYQYVYLKEE